MFPCIPELEMVFGIVNHHRGRLHIDSFALKINKCTKIIISPLVHQRFVLTLCIYIYILYASLKTSIVTIQHVKEILQKTDKKEKKAIKFVISGCYQVMFNADEVYRQSTQHLHHWRRFWAISLSLSNQQRSSLLGPYTRMEKAPTEAKTQANLFTFLQKVIAWHPLHFFPARAKRIRENRQWAVRRSVSKSSKAMYSDNLSSKTTVCTQYRTAHFVTAHPMFPSDVTNASKTLLV